MATATVQLRNIPGTEAAAGWTGGHTIVVDRPDGKAGGMDLGFNGGQLLALAIGGCFCNDLRYVSHEMGIDLATIEVDVTLDMEGTPLIATHAVMRVHATAATRTPTSMPSSHALRKSRPSRIRSGAALPSRLLPGSLYRLR